MNRDHHAIRTCYLVHVHNRKQVFLKASGPQEAKSQAVPRALLPKLYWLKTTAREPGMSQN